MLRQYFSALLWGLAALTFALAISTPNGYGIPTGLLFLASASLFYLRPKWCDLSLEDRRLFYAFLAFGLSMFVFVYLDGWYTRELDRPSRFILVLPVLLMLLQSSNHKEWLWYGAIVGAIGAFALACYEKFVLGIDRAHGSEYPIMFGNTGMLLGLLSLAGASYFLAMKRYFWLSLALIAAIAGIGSSFLSGSRGGWIALPIIGCFMLWQSRELFSKKSLVGVLVAAFILLGVAVAVPQTGVMKKVDQTLVSLSQYYSGENKATSLGMRFDMWVTAYHLFQESPILGVGEYGEKAEKKRMVEQGVIPPAMLHFNHAHNEFINALSQRGLVGLAFLLLVYLVPMRLFIKKMEANANNWRIKSYAMAGALIPMCYMDFGLSQVMFAHNIGVMMYAFPIVYFWAATRWAEREELGESKSN
ncbi:O-antigen ligase family protein [Marinomonas sp.]